MPENHGENRAEKEETGKRMGQFHKETQIEQVILRQIAENTKIAKFLTLFVPIYAILPFGAQPRASGRALFYNLYTPRARHGRI